ncbi:MarR family winged helix-turn-helix transcriptional regulator [Phenylobacterium montanum]|uniref:MarR family transcriptional regulator n=1 Tax=Phenylobacterium montanum TaxID=2823693 RepID=A0A975FX44_9CAUL|nr:MarR family transcriptional regulator [Caulobacter sp. S6]QUD86574.1 MarR family transcriptional regulator [Caulobacter sp. S6]
MSQTESDAAAISRAVMGLSRRLRAEQPEQAVGLTALGVLASLQRSGPLSAAQLAADQRLQPQSLTRVLGEMERSALIRRKRNPADRRALIIEITPIGRHRLASDVRQGQGWLDQAMAAKLTVAERAILRLAAYLMQKLASDADV